MFRVLVILLFLAGTLPEADAGPDSSRFVHFDISNGFPSNNVYSLVTDKYGYTWFATDKGIVKYNGYTFTNFNTSNGLPSDDVWELVPDKTGRVWVYSFTYQIGYMKNGIYNMLNYKSSKRILSAYYMSSIGNTTYFLLGDDKKGELVFVAGDIVKIIPFDRSESLQKKRGVIDSYIGDSLFLCVMDSNEHIYKWDLLKGEDKYEFVFKADEALRYGYRYRRTLSPAREQYSFRFNYKTLHRHGFESKVIDKPLTLREMGADSAENIYAFNPYYLPGNYNRNSVLITNSHIYSISPDFKFQKREAIKGRVPTNAQLAYFVLDNMGNEWYTTKEDGVWALPKKNRLLSSLKFDQLLKNCVLAGVVGSKSYWWDKHALSLHVLERNMLLQTILFPAGAMVRSVTGGADGLFIGGESGIYYFNEQNRELQPLENKFKTRFKFEKQEPHHKALLQHRKSAFEYVNYIEQLNGSVYSLASDYALKHSIKGDSVISEILYPERFTGMQSMGAITLLYNSRKLVATNNFTGKATTFFEDVLKSIGITNIRQIETDAFGNWYFLDDEKLLVCNPAAKCFKELRFRVNLRDAQLRIAGKELILAGKFGLGYATIEGACKVGHLKVASNFTIGKPGYNQIRGFSLSEGGYVVLQTDKGIFDFTLRELRAAADVRGGFEGVFKLLLRSPFECQISGNDTFAVVQGDDKISFDVVNYLGKGAVEYFYRTEYSNEWSNSASGEMFVSNLGPGKYHRILIKAKDDLWESPTYSFYIYRYPFWWQTETWRTVFWTVGVLLLLALVLVTVLVTRYYVAKKNERKRALTELELKAIHSQLNPHFIFNTLSAAMYYINKKRFDDAYTHVSKFSQLLRSYLKSSQDRFITLDEEIKMLRNYIELQQIRFEKKFEYKIEIDNKLPIANIQIPSLLLQPLVENAINHGLFHLEGNEGLLLLEFRQGKDSSELICIIDDNGVGRLAAQKINDRSTKLADDDAKSESYGTKLTYQLLDVFKQYAHLDITLDYLDKSGPETGTIVTLTLKNIKYVA